MTEARDPDLTREEVLHLLQYEAGSGIFFWRNPRNNKVKPGDLAGHVAPTGHVRITLGRKRVLAHRIAWLIAVGDEPDGYIDHRDGNPLNNRIDNLRLATASQNAMNARRPTNNTSGCKGVLKSKRHDRRFKPWCAYITYGRNRKTIGYFKTFEEAAAARIAAGEKLHGDFAREDEPFL